MSFKDNVRYIIPNSTISGMLVTNTSYHQRLRGTFIKVPIAYTADVRKAIGIIREVVMQCPYTFPNNPANEDLGGYGEVYLMSYDENSLNLETTIWTEPSMDNFLAASEIRIRILEAFRNNDLLASGWTRALMMGGVCAFALPPFPRSALPVRMCRGLAGREQVAAGLYGAIRVFVGMGMRTLPCVALCRKVRHAVNAWRGS